MRIGRPQTWHSLLGVGILFGGILVAMIGCSAPRPEPIQLYNGQWDSLRINNAIAAYVIEHGYDRPTEEVVLAPEEMLDKLISGRIDLNMEGWTVNWPDRYAAEIDRGTIVNLGPTFRASRQFFTVPQTVAERHGIESIDDMADHWQLFRDPEDPTKGIFYNCPQGTRCAEINRILLEAFGLRAYYNVVHPPSLAALETILERNARDGQPVFGYYWTPTRLMWTYDWHVVAMPDHTASCWTDVIAARGANGPAVPEAGCAYPEREIDKLVHRSLADRAPEIAAMLKRMTVGLDPLNAVGDWMERRGVVDAEAIAERYLRKYPERWRGWLEADAVRRVERALTASDAE